MNSSTPCKDSDTGLETNLHSTECHECHHHQTVPSTQQTLNEMEFERGIWDAVLHKQISRIRQFIREGRTMDRDNYNYTALHYAARAGDLEICELLLIEGRAEVNAVTKGGATPLHRASSMGHLKIVQLLLEHAAIVELQDNDGQTALHRAVTGNHHSVCEYLIGKHPHLKTLMDRKGKVPSEYLKDDASEDLRSLLSSD